MELHPLTILFGFLIIALASRQIGDFFSRLHLPIISGFLFTGIIAGPFVLGLLPEGISSHLRFLDHVALAFIAFAAGSELHLNELKGRWKSIRWITIGLVSFTFVLGTLAVLLLADYVPFMRDLPIPSRFAVAILAGAILTARSPSSAIAVVNELRAKGPFTKTTLGVTVLMDVVVIVLFSINSAIADTLLKDVGFSLSFIFQVIQDMSISIITGLALGLFLSSWFASRFFPALKTTGMLLSGYAIFAIAGWLEKSDQVFFFSKVHLEPLLICMLSGFYLANFTKHRVEFTVSMERVSPAVYIVFFTLTGASLNLRVLATTWAVALALFSVRIIAIAIGSYLGGSLAGDPDKQNRINWMAFITQAGIGLGLAKEVSGEHAEWGSAFATMMIAVIVLNQIIGPPFFKWAIQKMGEAHTKATGTLFSTRRFCVIFGMEDQAMTLARQLKAQDWKVRIATRKYSEMRPEEIEESDIEIVPLKDLTEASLIEVAANKAEALVCLLEDKENYIICCQGFEKFGTHDLVVRLRHHENAGIFNEFGALIVDPQTAVVSLLENFVTSPVATSLLLGMEKDHEIFEIEVLDKNWDGVTIRDLGLPLNVHIMSIHRDGNHIISSGHTQLQLHDYVSVTGKISDLHKVQLMLED